MNTYKLATTEKRFKTTTQSTTTTPPSKPPHTWLRKKADSTPTSLGYWLLSLNTSASLSLSLRPPLSCSWLSRDTRLLMAPATLPASHVIRAVKAAFRACWVRVCWWVGGVREHGCGGRRVSVCINI